MSFLSSQALLVWLGLPLLFAALVPLVRRFADPAEPEDGAEKRALLLSLAPFAVGLLLLTIARFVPIDLPTMPLLGEAPLPEADGHSHAEHVGVRFDMPPLWLLGAGMYGLVAAFRLLMLLHGREKLRRMAGRALRSEIAPDVYLTTELSVPVIDGRGRILLPEELAASLGPDALDLILSHERAHHARGDQRYFVGLAAIDALFWAHPGVRWQTARCRLAAELACDEKTCAEHPSLRKAYAELIVKTLHHAAGNALPCAPAVFSPRTKGEFGMRLTKIMRPRTGARKGRGLALAAAALLPLSLGQLALAQGGDEVAFSVTPVEDGRVTSRWGLRNDPWDKGKKARHFGTDIAAPLGTPVVAPGPGVVTRAEDAGAYGLLLEVSHAGGVVTRYAQLDNFERSVGDQVRAGQLIARVGSSGQSTGPHLHLEVFVDGTRVDPETMVPMPD